jgi:DNA-directed RNA polymerase subunit RPC12/RpoP
MSHRKMRRTVDCATCQRTIELKTGERINRTTPRFCLSCQPKILFSKQLDMRVILAPLKRESWQT